MVQYGTQCGCNCTPFGNIARVTVSCKTSDHADIIYSICNSFHFYNVSPLKISNHNAFYNFLSGCSTKAFVHSDKMDRNRLLKDITSPEAVTLIEGNDNEVLKLLNYEYI